MARRLHEPVGEVLVHALVLHPPAVSALVLAGHHLPAEGEVVHVLGVVHLDQVNAYRGKERAEQWDFDALASAAAAPGDQGRGDGDGAREGAEGAGGRKRQKQGFARGALGPAIEPGGRADDGVPAPLVAMGTLLAEPRQGAVDEVWVHLREACIPDAEPVGHPGAEVLDQDVGGPRQLLGPRLTF